MKKILIDVEEDYLKYAKASPNKTSGALIILNGTILNNLTNGQVLMQAFPEAEIIRKSKFKIEVRLTENWVAWFYPAWWNTKWRQKND